MHLEIKLLCVSKPMLHKFLQVLKIVKSATDLNSQKITGLRRGLGEREWAVDAPVSRAAVMAE